MVKSTKTWHKKSKKNVEIEKEESSSDEDKEISEAEEEDDEDIADDDEEFEQDEDEDEEEEEENQGDGFANALSQLLQQDTGDKVPVLAGRKTSLMKQLEKNKQENVELKGKRLERKKKLKSLLVDPNNVNIEFERQLRKLATKGVVALFNAVAKSKRDSADVDRKEKDKKKQLLKAAGVGMHPSSNDDNHSVGSGGSLSIDSFVKNTETSLLKKRSLRELENNKSNNNNSGEGSNKRSKKAAGVEMEEAGAGAGDKKVKNKGWKVLSDNLEDDVSLDWDKEEI